MGSQLFPSFAIATATLQWPGAGSPYYLGDRNGLVGITITSPSDDAEIKLQVTIPDLAEPSVFEGVLKEGGKSYKVFPEMAYRYQTLLGIKQPLPAFATFALYVNGSLEGTKRKAFTVRSINDCPYVALADDDSNKAVRIPWMFAAYVNENHPWIDSLLREALNTAVVSNFVGYQGGPQGVYSQVFAIWNVFQRRGFRYSSITTPTGQESGRVSSQYVRFLEDSIRTSQANCVDGSVLFASVLRRIGIDVVLIMIPGHCFLGFYLDQRHSSFCALETTMMGNTALSQYSEDHTVAGAIAHLRGQATRNQASFQSFIGALAEGNAKYNSTLEALRRKAPGYDFIDIAACRRFGIRPINH
jgi:hypothetical protein